MEEYDQNLFESKNCLSKKYIKKKNRGIIGDKHKVKVAS